MQPRTLELLRSLGIARTLIERGNAAAQVRLHFGKRVIAMGLFDIGLEDTAFPFLLFVSLTALAGAVQVLVLSRGRYPNIRRHAIRAVRRGWPRVMVVNRPGAAARTPSPNLGATRENLKLYYVISSFGVIPAGGTASPTR